MPNEIQPGVLNKVKMFAGATGRDLHIDGPLSNLTIGYRPTNLIADKIYPVVATGKQSDLYYVWTQADWMRIPNAQRAAGSPANRINFAVSSNTFFCKEYSLAMDIPLQDYANADEALDYRNAPALMVVDALALAWEDRVATLLTTAANVGSSTTLTNAWSDPINGTPIDDIFTGHESVRQSTGVEPNTMILSGRAWNNLRKHPQTIDFVRGKGDNTGGGTVTLPQVAAAFFPNGNGKVLLGSGIKNTAGEGATASYTDIWSTACILLHVAPTPGRMVPSHGYTFQWRPSGLAAPFAVQRYENRREATESVEVLHFQDEKVTASNLGYLIVGC